MHSDVHVIIIGASVLFDFIAYIIIGASLLFDFIAYMGTWGRVGSIGCVGLEIQWIP